MSKFAEKKMLCEELENIASFIENRLKDVEMSYERVGEEQAKDWMGNLRWEDEEESIPKMTSVWEYVPKEMTEEEKSRAKLLRKIMNELEKLV